MDFANQFEQIAVSDSFGGCKAKQSALDRVVDVIRGCALTVNGQGSTGPVHAAFDDQ